MKVRMRERKEWSLGVFMIVIFAVFMVTASYDLEYRLVTVSILMTEILISACFLMGYYFYDETKTFLDLFIFF